MGILGSVFGGTYLATRGGGAKEQQKIQQGPPVAAGSKDEEDFIQYVHCICFLSVLSFTDPLQELPQVRGRRRRAKVPAVNLFSSIELVKAAYVRARGGSP